MIALQKEMRSPVVALAETRKCARSALAAGPGCRYRLCMDAAR